ncbi:MAG: pyruvate kinase [Bacteroidales bacterium]|nr:pyruvate kinase [Bacteroidales bacterium]
MPKTKIVATISDRNAGVDFIQSLFDEGMRIIRLNTAHQTPEQTLKIVENARQVSDKIALLLDTKGPELRTTESSNEISVSKGDIINVEGDPGKASDENRVYVNYKDLADDVPEGSEILIDDGDISLTVKEKRKNALVCRVNNGGVIKSRKSVNVPKVKLNLPCVTEKDNTYIHFAIEQELDFIAHSFVRSKEDVLAIQQLLDEHESDIKIIAKIENQEGVDNIDEILDYAYGIMVARGDLGIEIPYERIPGIQKYLVNKCIERRKPVIIATQMLHSMINNPRPTRAEVTDIASAIYGQADAVMLSGETAFGKYPVESVRTMARVAKEVEGSKEPFYDTPAFVINNKVTAYLCKSAVKASIRLDTKAVIADTTSGKTIRSIAAYRGKKPVYAQCYSRKTMRELQLSYGVRADYMKPRETSHEFLQHAITNLKKNHQFTDTDMVVVLAGNFGRSAGATYIEIGTLQNLVGNLGLPQE